MNSVCPFSSTATTNTAVVPANPITQKPEDNTSPPTNNESAKNDLKLHAAVKQQQVQQQYQEQQNIDAFFDKIFIASFQRKPQALDQLNLPESLHQQLNDYSIEGKKEDIEAAKANLIALQSYDIDSLTPQQKITYKVLEWQLQHKIAGERFLYHEYLITHTHGVLEDLFQTFSRFQKIEKEYDFADYRLRLQEVPDQLEQVKEILRQQSKMGIKLPQFSYEKILSKLDFYITSSAKEHPFYIYCEQHIDSMSEVEQSCFEVLEQILNGQVIPAFTEFRQFLLELSLASNAYHGLCALPDGKEYYAYCLKGHTTTNLTIEEMDEIGQIELNRILKEIRAILATQGFTNSQKSVGYLLGVFNKTKRVFLLRRHSSKEKDYIRSFNNTLVKSQSLLRMQLQKKGAPLLRKKGDFRAYAEGWELFSETISDEKGVYKNICDKLDFLQFQLLSTIKLIVDIGIHAKGWSFDDAINFMQMKTGFDRVAIVEEVENCFVNPGQACTSKIGQHKFQEWRKKAMDALGTRFYFPTFCSIILDSAGVPLAVLEGIINEYILRIGKDAPKGL